MSEKDSDGLWEDSQRSIEEEAELEGSHARDRQECCEYAVSMHDVT